jgi:hypothetical protein
MRPNKNLAQNADSDFLHFALGVIKRIGASALFCAAACSGDSSSEGAVNACALLEDGEIAAALGADITPGQRMDAGLILDGDSAGAYSSTCLWRIGNQDGPDADAPLGDADYVILMAMQWPEDKDAELFLQSFRDASDEGVIPHAPAPLAIGDASLWWGDGVAVVVGQTSVGVSVRLVNERERRRTVAEDLAKIVASRL